MGRTKSKSRRRSASRKSKSYLQSKTTAPTVKITGGSFDKSDIFIGVAALAVIAFVVIIGGGKSDGSGSTTKPNLSSPNLSGSGVHQQQQQPMAEQNETNQPDAEIEADREAGSDQYGSKAQSQNLKEIDNQKFTIGESQVAHTFQSYGARQKTDRPDAMIEARREAGSDQYGSQPVVMENNTADLINDAAKKVKKDLKENAIADELQDKSKLVKSAMKESENGIPYHANVGGAPTSDPFDVFSSPEAKIQTQPNIDSTGFGHSKYTAGNVRQFNSKSYPTDGRVFFYDKAPLGPGLAAHHYNENQADGSPHTYQEVVKQNQEIQLQRNTKGFGTNSYNTLGTRVRYPNHDFLPGSEPNFFKMQAGSNTAEREIANEMGSTGHSWEQRTLKSGLKSTSPAAADTPLGQGSGAFTRGDDKSNISGKKDADWAKKKVKVRGSVMKIVKLFDRLFSEELFPDAVVDVQDDGKLFVRDGKEGRCILLARYYEYVENTIKATLGLGRAAPLTWAKSIELNFESIEKNKIPLRGALDR